MTDVLDWPAVRRDQIKERLAATGDGSADHSNLKTLEVFFAPSVSS